MLREQEAAVKTEEVCRRAGSRTRPSTSRDLGRDLPHLWTAHPWQEGFGSCSDENRLQKSIRRSRSTVRPNGKSAHTLLDKWSASRAIIKDRV